MLRGSRADFHKAVEANTDLRWVVLYVRRWLHAPLQLPEGTLRQRDRGTPQGFAVSPPGQPGSVGDIRVELHGTVRPVGGGVPLADDQMQVLERRAGHKIAAVELSHPPFGVVFGVP